MKYIVILISIILDIIFLNFYNYSYGYISWFYPMLTITSISFISKYYNLKNKTKYFLVIIIFSIIYDILVINNLFLTIFLFLQIAYINIYLNSIFPNSLISIIIKALISLVVYDVIFYIILVVINYYDFSINVLIYKISHSIILNLIYVSGLFLVLKKDKP